MRGEDIACRFGGEEFVIILPKASLEGTKRRAERIRQDAKLLAFPGIDRRHPPVTISLGVAAFPVHGSTGEDLLHAADEAVYKAKAKGRDRVVIAGNRPRRAIAVEAPSQPQIDRESRPAS